MASFLDPRPVPWAIWSNKNCHSWKIPPICLKILLDFMMTFPLVFIWVCGGLSIPKTLHIDAWEMAWVTAMAAGRKQTRSVHVKSACGWVGLKRYAQPTIRDMMHKIWYVPQYICHSSGLSLDILKMESWTHMGRTANIIIKDVIHVFASIRKIMRILLMRRRNRERWCLGSRGLWSRPAIRSTALHLLQLPVQ